MFFKNRNGWLHVHYYEDGERKRKSTGLRYTDANILAYKNSLVSGSEIDLSFMGLLNEVLEEKRLLLKKSSILNYESVIKSLVKPYYKDVLITELKALFIHQWQIKLVTRGITSNTIIFARSLVNQAINRAILKDLIAYNPLRAVSTLSSESGYEKKPFSLYEVGQILKEAKGQFRNLLGLAFFSGMRTGEILALKWSDIDFINRTISINRTVNKGIIQTPKTKSSKRVIEIIDACYPYIENQQLNTKLKNEFVFIGYNNTHYSSSYNLRYSFKKLLDNAKVEYRAIRQTRHTFASIMLSEGEPLLWVSEMLGHKNPSITLKAYSKYIKRERIKRASFLDDFNKNVV